MMHKQQKRASRLLVCRHPGAGEKSAIRKRSTMAQGTLNEILEVEKQIKAMLDNEAAKAQEWLEKAKREIEEARQSAISDLNASVARGREEAKAEADKKGAEMVRRAHALADRIERLDDDSLREFIWEHIVDILPRITRDR